MRTSALALLAAAAIAGCSSSSSPAPSRPSASTGVMAFVANGTAARLYHAIPSDPVSGHARLGVYDVAVAAGGNAFVKTIDLGAVGKARAVGADGTDVVVSDQDTRTVYFVDATTDLVKGAAPLPVDTEVFVASGGPSYTDGVAVDAVARKAYVSVSYGLLEYDLGTRALTKTLHAPRPENFALDRNTGRIYAPYYLCDPTYPDGPDVCTGYPPDRGPALTDGLTVIDTATSKGWALVDPASATPRYPIGKEVDSMTIDPELHLAAAAVEYPADGAPNATLYIFDLGKATYDDASATCRMNGLRIDMPGDLFVNQVLDPVNHLLAVGREHALEITFVDLAQAAKGVVATYDAGLPPRGDGTDFVNWGDPHGAAFGVVAGKPYVFFVSEDRATVARIDMQGVKAVMGGSGSFAAQVGYLDTGTP